MPRRAPAGQAAPSRAQRLLAAGATVGFWAAIVIVIAGSIGAAGVALGQGDSGALELRAPRLVALGAPVALRGSGADPGERVVAEVRDAGGGWRRAGEARADDAGRFAVAARPPGARRRVVARARTSGGTASPPVSVRARPITLAAVGDINLGDGPGEAIAAHGPAYPWQRIGRSLRAADVALGNLECAVSRRGSPQAKQFTFRGDPGALRAMRRVGGLDVVGLANNHAGDFGRGALLDTMRHVRRAGIVPFGAGRDAPAAVRPVVVERLGLRIAFVGFSEVLPAEFAAGPGRAGTSWATDHAVAAGVRAARHRADVVVATFHWGIELQTHPTERQRALARAALAAGADAVIGAHPHVLQPTERAGRRLTAYSLGNFVFSAHSPGTTATGILHLRLSARGVEAARMQRARIEGVRPVPAASA